eukprot:CAMPEP_0206020086 /NCGR_PEP_ID=MMETSP1464-20131121/30343_1 /ASSEMBLY_ACC=CAM_ASM_001124 /TAXON_ID=119497 /ORGANISM="Exanthemachrysis gayraliae, Strain RCC1523" /LENGTH=343 /DNA_ID=CAMNT_0053394007 /DNA_START=120 /DNA_END=1148 /DNA_ORIENTATION=-
MPETLADPQGMTRDVQGVATSGEGAPAAVGAGSDSGRKSAQLRAEEVGSLGPAELRAAIRKQVEYYFSRENLMTDTYLKQQMDAQMYVPLATIAAFNNVRMLGADERAIRDALEGSQVVALDPTGSLVRPNVKAARTTLVLRELTAETTEAEVRAVFEDEGCPRPTEAHPDVNETWFVTFATEEEATDALLRTRGKLLRGKPVRARVKSESAMRSFYREPAPLMVAVPGMAPSGAVLPPGSAAQGVAPGIPSPTAFPGADGHPNGGSFYGPPALQSPGVPYYAGPGTPGAWVPGMGPGVPGQGGLVYGPPFFPQDGAVFNPYAEPPQGPASAGNGGRGNGRGG